MIKSVKFFLGHARVSFHDGTAVDVACRCWSPAATDDEARQVAAIVALQCRAAHSPEAAQFVRLTKLLGEASDVCFRLKEKLRRGDTALIDFWRMLTLVPPDDAPRRRRVVRVKPGMDFEDVMRESMKRKDADPLGVHLPIPDQIAAAQARLGRLSIKLSADIPEKVTHLHVVWAANLAHRPCYLNGRQPKGYTEVRLADVTRYYAAGVEPPELEPELPRNQRRKLAAGKRPATLLPAPSKGIEFPIVVWKKTKAPRPRKSKPQPRPALRLAVGPKAVGKKR